jgi:PAS domain S-box-containing protein
MNGMNDDILRAAWESAEAAVAVFTAERRFLAVNDRYLALTGYSLDEALSHRPGENLRLDPLDQDRFIELITSQTSAGEADILLKDGTPLGVEYVVIPTRVNGARCFVGMLWPLVVRDDQSLTGQLPVAD